MPPRRPRDTIPAARFITKHGKPLAKLVPFDEEPPTDAFGMLAGTVIGHDDIVSPDADAWREES